MPAAIAFHERIGGRRKQQHLQSLRNYWVERVRDIRGHGDPDAGRARALRRGHELPAARDERLRAGAAASALLLEKHRVLTVRARGIAAGAAVRVTPALYNTHDELDRFVGALRVESRAFA